MTAAQDMRAAIEGAIDALIVLLDAMDGDADSEPDMDASADDFGEPTGATWLQPPLSCARIALHG